MDPKSAKKDRRPAEDALTMPLVELAGRIQEEAIRHLAERLGRNPDMQFKWGQYLSYRTEHKLPVTVRALRGHLEMLAQLHPNPQEAYHALHWTMLRGNAAYRAWEFPVPMPKNQPRRPLPGHKAALEAAGIKPAEAGTPTEADLVALQEYKDLAETMTPAERAALLKKCSDTLPALSGSLAARIATLNYRDTQVRPAYDALQSVAQQAAQGMRAERAETSPRVWHNRMKEVEQKDAKETKGGGS